MTSKNPEYDFKWCPGCGDFGVRRAIENAIEMRRVETELPAENNVIIAGIGCSGNMVHLLEGAQPYGFHGIHGRSLPIAMGVKMANPDLNVVVVAGDGDFLGIGLEHIGPQAARNLNITAVIMDNAVYGLTKGQSSPTTELDTITSSTPFGKHEVALNALNLYLTLGVSYVASEFSSRVKFLAQTINEAMKHPGFAVVHVQSPCTTYNDTFDVLRGNAKKGIEKITYEISDDHDPSDMNAAYAIANDDGVPLGVIYRDDSRLTLDQRVDEAALKGKQRPIEDLLDFYKV